ncbi:MAG TPA: pilus assembly protein TadG-related protein, partial [Paracoccaceae bacterium]|nr:pilus assembly protein TadG-related protein [Paracoccaceae bacterium]
MLPALSRFRGDASGAVAVIAALTLPILIGFSALALEYGHGLLIRAENQRVADLASYAAAAVHVDEPDQDLKEARASTTAINVAALNGVQIEEDDVEFPEDDDGNDLVRVRIQTQRDLLLARVLGDFAELEINVAATTLISEGDPGYACVLALEGGTVEDALTVAGNFTLNLDHCSLASNNEFRINGNPTINAHCTSPGADRTEGKCQDGWNRGGPFEDPHEIDWLEAQEICGLGRTG